MGNVTSWSAHNSDHLAKKTQTRYKELSGMDAVDVYIGMLMLL